VAHAAAARLMECFSLKVYTAPPQTAAVQRSAGSELLLCLMWPTWARAWFLKSTKLSKRIADLHLKHLIE
jgi:hypothetical protein